MVRPVSQRGDGTPAEGWVLHVDLDQFLAAVEVLRRPELAGRPVVVGGDGDPTKRGVVSTASYEAREHGVRSGMPLRTALKRCPDAVFLPVDRPEYDAASAVVMETLRASLWEGEPVLVEVLGWDEAFLARAAPGGDAWAYADQLRAEVLEATRLHCSVGIGDAKLRAKMATDLGKPRGVFELTASNWFEVMGDRPTDALWGVGRKTSAKLAALGITTVRQLAESDASELAAELGPTMGPWYHRIGRGADTSPVDPTPYVPRAHGRETTFQTDLEDPAVIEASVRELAVRALADIEAEGRPAVRVGLKVRTRSFRTVQRSLSLPEPTYDAATLADAAVALLARIESDRPIRLLGVRLEMAPPEGGY